MKRIPRSRQAAADQTDRIPSRLPADQLTLMHELQVHQEEVLIQNQQLIEAQAALEDTRDRYIELFDFAPNGYLLLDPNGIVLQINLTGASLFGHPRDTLIGMPLLGRIESGRAGDFLDYLRRCRAHAGGVGPSLEIGIRTASGPRHAQFICNPRFASSGHRELFMAMVDITERKRLEAQREAALREQMELVGRLLSVQEDERRRIARDIHDHLGQQVTALRLKLELFAQERSPTRLASSLAELQQMAQRLDTQLDFFTGQLRPAVLDDLGLRRALEQFVHEWSSTFRVGAEFHASGLEDARFDPAAETHLYRFTQEALNNVYKHAAATHVAVMLERRDDRLTLIIEDNGRGFDPQRLASGAGGRGLGIIGMRERATLIGGEVEVETAPGRGTTVFLRAPWSRCHPPERQAAAR